MEELIATGMGVAVGAVGGEGIGVGNRESRAVAECANGIQLVVK